MSEKDVRTNSSESTSRQLELQAVHEELARTNSELLQLTLELDGRVDERTRALKKSEGELRRHRDHLEELVKERTAELRSVNEKLEYSLGELRESEERFACLVKTIPDIVYRISPTGHFTFINEAVSKLGYSPEELIGKHFEQLISPQESETISRKNMLSDLKENPSKGSPHFKLVDERRTGERMTTGLVVGLKKKGKSTLNPAQLFKLGKQSVVVEINAAGLYTLHDETDNQVFIGTVGVIRDITERQAMEKKLNEAYGTLEQRVEERTKELEVTNQKLLTEISEHAQAEKDLLESELLLRSVLNGMGAAVFFVDPKKYAIIDANTTGQKMLGLSLQEITGHQCCDLICSEKNAAAEQHCPIYMTKILNKEQPLHLPDGRTIPVIKHVLPVQLKNRNIHVEIIFDVSERKSLERQLAYAQKLESIGQLAAGIAHEINTPIQYIGDNINYIQTAIKCLPAIFEAVERLLQIRQPTGDVAAAAQHIKELLESNRVDEHLKEIPEAISDSLDGVGRVASIVKAMKKFSHPDLETTKVIDVNATIQNTLTVARNEWKYCSEIETNFAKELPQIQFVPGDFNQAILNIVVNAAHANAEKYEHTNEKGAIRITTRRDDNHINIDIQDTGTGISREHFDKIFDPFFTTKDVGRGTGQGLAITHAIVEKHKGSLTFESELGQGTTFTLSLPINTTHEDNYPS